MTSEKRMFTLDWRKNISNAQKGVKKAPRTKQHCLNLSKSKLGEKNPMFGKTTSEKQKQSVRAMRGEYSPHWKGGKETLHARKSLSEHKRRDAIRNGRSDLTIDGWNSIKTEYCFTCPRCQRSEPNIKLTIDHVVPISCGGENTLSNIQPLCKQCNSSKKNRYVMHYIPIAFTQEI